MAFTYILFSKKLNKFYIGATQESIEERINKHNTKSYGVHHFTAKAEDWSLFLSFETEDFKHAFRLENKIKKMKSKVYIQNLVKYPELRIKIINETKE